MKAKRIPGVLATFAYASDAEEAIPYLNKAIALNPKNKLSQECLEDDRCHYYPYFIRGKAYKRLEQFEKAIDDFNKAILLKEFNTGADEVYIHRQIGLTYLSFSREVTPQMAVLLLEKGIDNFTKAIELAEENTRGLENYNAMAYHSRAHNYLKLKQYDQALSDINKALEIDPVDTAKIELRNNILEERPELKP